MTDLNDTQRIDRGRRAQMALDEFLTPALNEIIAAYSARVEELAATQPWEAARITALANAIRIARQVDAQIRNHVIEGELARTRQGRAREMEKLTPARRRFLDMVPH